MRDLRPWERWPDPRKPFFFRAPPVATEVLQLRGVDCVTLANNHALDFGADALLDTFRNLSDAGIAWVGAGADEATARSPTILERGGSRIGIVGLTDHPCDFAAAPDRPGVAYADLREGVPGWLLGAIGGVDTEIVLVTPHWGPNMVSEPVAHVRKAAAAFRAAGATPVAGRSAHVFHAVADGVLHDLGDFIDDYAPDAELRNDLGLLFLVSFDHAIPTESKPCPAPLTSVTRASRTLTRQHGSADGSAVHVPFSALTSLRALAVSSLNSRPPTAPGRLPPDG